MEALGVEIFFPKDYNFQDFAITENQPDPTIFREAYFSADLGQDAKKASASSIIF